MPEVLVGRHKRLSFMKVDDTFKRMTKFTSLSESKSPIEYSRQYVDESSESTDVVGYSSAVGYSFDRHSDNDVHKILASIADDEKFGTEAQVEIVTVDIFEQVSGNENSCKARMRKYSVIPDSIADGTDALIYSGNFRAVSEISIGTATTSDKWQTVTFVADED